MEYIQKLNDNDQLNRMNTPKIPHPKKYEISGIFFQVISDHPLTDEQASRLVEKYFSSKEFLESDRGKTFDVESL